MRTKADVIGDLRGMLKDVFAAKAAGQTYARLARAHGYVDGYMRALIDTGVIERDELLCLVAAERERASGPALGDLAAASLDEAVVSPAPRAAREARVTVPAPAADADDIVAA